VAQQLTRWCFTNIVVFLIILYKSITQNKCDLLVTLRNVNHAALQKKRALKAKGDIGLQYLWCNLLVFSAINLYAGPSNGLLH
jgi:hypothetical protein